MKISTLSPLAAAAFAMMHPTAAAAQEAPPMPAPGSWENPGATAIQVTGNPGLLLPNSPISGGAAASRAASSDARRFVRCIHHAPASLLRPIVEGHARDPGTRDALDRVIRTNPGCYQGYAPAAGSAPSYYGRCNPITVNDNSLCRSVYDRGALVEDAFNTYAPKFMLMPADTRSDAVVGRFAAREEARGKFRSPMDRRFYETVACMVRLEPQRATRLLRAEPGLEREARIRNEIILRTRKACANNARVKVDGFQFRAYLADALYHWTLAAKNVETLVTASR